MTSWSIFVQVEALLAACSLQSVDISNVSSSISSTTNPVIKQQNLPDPVLTNVSNISQKVEGAAEEKRKRDVAPRRHIGHAEFESISGYLKGRLTLDKVRGRSVIFITSTSSLHLLYLNSNSQVNAAVEELAVHAENNNRLLAALRSTTQKLSGVERKRAAELTHAMAVRPHILRYNLKALETDRLNWWAPSKKFYYKRRQCQWRRCVFCFTVKQGKEGMKGRHFLLESDLRDGMTLKLDKTSKSILIILRQLGRISEVSVDQGGVVTPNLDNHLPGLYAVVVNFLPQFDVVSSKAHPRRTGDFCMTICVIVCSCRSAVK